ncbi:MAG: 30S ribosomal protein S2, partial [Actinomycetota bacterium]|nr:30S ribosomal protein S2 [Actinomycetota bacterium]
TRTPSAIWVVDTNKEHLAVNEARKLGIPVVAVLDTNCDPDVVDYKIPGNDDAIRSIGTLTRVIADAVAEGLMARAGANAQADSKPEAGQLAGDEPLPEWEAELLAPAGAGLEAPSTTAPVEPAPQEQ